MGFPINETDWCPSDIITQKNFSLPTYSISTAIKGTINKAADKDNRGIEKCAKLCDQHNVNNSGTNWECTGDSYRPTNAVAEYDSNSPDLSIWGRGGERIGHKQDDPYICNEDAISFSTKTRQDQDGLTPVNTCEELSNNMHQRCKAGFPSYYCFGADDKDFDPKMATKKTF